MQGLMWARWSQGSALAGETNRNMTDDGMASMKAVRDSPLSSIDISVNNGYTGLKKES
jgi:hypothetical protein